MTNTTGMYWECTQQVRSMCHVRGASEQLNMLLLLRRDICWTKQRFPWFETFAELQNPCLVVGFL